jgi:hypothetical protein
LIVGATNSTYTLVQADAGQNIKCVVTACDSDGCTNADSNVVYIYDSDAQLYITNAGITNENEKLASNYLFIELKSASIYSKVKALYPYLGGTASSCKYNAVNPLDTNGAFRQTYAGGVTFDYFGIKGNGVNGYADTFFVPSSNFASLNNKSFGVSIRGNILGGIDMGSLNGSNFKGDQLTSRFTGDICASLNSNINALTSPSTDSRGFWISNRTSNTVSNYYKNANSLLSLGNSDSQHNSSMTILGRKTGASSTTPTSRQHIFGWIGDGLTPTEITTLKNIELNFQILAGRVVNGNIGVIGDSTIASYLGTSAIFDFFNFNGTLTSVATAGDTIAQQKTKWDALSSGTKLAMNYVFIQVGLNDLNPAETASVAMARYQTLVDKVILDAPNAVIVLGTMTPCRQRLINVYGAVDGVTAYNKWLAMNQAIQGGGAFPINGADKIAYSHTASLNDGSGNLAVAYDTGDGIHENNAGRLIIANSWNLIII